MAKGKTQEEIDAEIAVLKTQVETVRQRSMFGDDNRAAIEAQIKVLEEDQDDDDVADEGYDDYIESSAYDAVNWRDGDGGEGMSDDWADLCS